MPLIVPKILILPAVLVSPELAADRGVDKLCKAARGRRVGGKTEEDIAMLARGQPFAPSSAVAELGNRADAAVEWDALLARRLKRDALALFAAELDIRQCQVMPFKELGDFGGGRERLV